MKYEVRKEVEYGCTIFSVYNTETNTRVNYFATTEEAQAFADVEETARGTNYKTNYLHLNYLAI